jgi:hypothetical protein
MRGVWYILLVAACGRIDFRDVPADACTGACTPADGEVDAFVIVPGADTDGDTITDDQDNCIFVPNPAQHDEDADGRGDVCDNCPGVANPDQTNVGEINAAQPADTLGDACDPRPAGAGDAIAYFDTFGGGALSSDWSIISGTWNVAGDAVAQTDLLSDQRIHDIAITAVDYIVETNFTFTALDAGNVNGGVVWRMSQQSGNGWLCGVFRDDGVTPAVSLLMLWSLSGGAGNFERDRATIAEPKVGDSFRILAGAFGDLHYCALDSLQTGPTTTFTSNQNNSGVPGFRNNRVTGTYSYFVVYTLGGAP